ncbi:nuclease-related domain-containing protein [Fredinandcohnia sp. FSL W7-1320]|uniref:nuclease-related domain-containing protein n=1 Tax=Fredinandcohnia sp. FSL W7-1320 TaxID=2954540 RepID=UPI0030FDE810
MIIKKRTVPLELQLLKSNRARKKVPEKIEHQIITLEKGFIGETIFDQRMESLSLDSLTINDLLLETNRAHYQIDSLLISPPKIHIFEVKNFEGDFIVKGDQWKSLSTGKEIKNPLLQLSRSTSLLRQLLQQLGSNLTVEGHLIFINPEFYLYEAPPNLPIVFQPQLNRFVRSLNAQSSKIYDTHHTLAKKLLSIHIKKSPFSLLPAYDFDELEKGILCGECWNGFMEIGNQHKLKCPKCNKWEDKETAIIRCIEEFEHLFPHMKITVSTIFDWCQVIKSKKTIRKILSKRYKLIQFGRSSFYVKL